MTKGNNLMSIEQHEIVISKKLIFTFFSIERSKSAKQSGSQIFPFFLKIKITLKREVEVFLKLKSFLGGTLPFPSRITCPLLKSYHY